MLATAFTRRFGVDLPLIPTTQINWAGESAGLVDRIRPAAEIVRELAREGEERVRSLAARLRP